MILPSAKGTLPPCELEQPWPCWASQEQRALRTHVLLWHPCSLVHSAFEAKKKNLVPEQPCGFLVCPVTDNLEASLEGLPFQRGSIR